MGIEGLEKEERDNKFWNFLYETKINNRTNLNVYYTIKKLYFEVVYHVKRNLSDCLVLELNNI